MIRLERFDQAFQSGLIDSRARDGSNINLHHRQGWRLALDSATAHERPLTLWHILPACVDGRSTRQQDPAEPARQMCLHGADQQRRVRIQAAKS